MFKSYDEAIQFYVDNEVDEEEAKRLAKAQFPDDDPNEGPDGEPSGGEDAAAETKSVLKSISKSLSEIKDRVFSKSHDDDDDDPTEPLDEGEEVEVGEYLSSMEKSIGDTEKTLGELEEWLQHGPPMATVSEVESEAITFNPVEGFAAA